MRGSASWCQLPRYRLVGSEVESAGRGMFRFPEAAALLRGCKTMRVRLRSPSRTTESVSERCRSTPRSMQTTFSRLRAHVGQRRSVSGRFRRLAECAESATPSRNPRCAGARQTDRPCSPRRVLRRAQVVASNSHVSNDAERGGHCTRLRDDRHILRVPPAQYSRRAPAPIRRFLNFVEPPK